VASEVRKREKLFRLAGLGDAAGRAEPGTDGPATPRFATDRPGFDRKLPIADPARR
jgi:hypothetical protein